MLHFATPGVPASTPGKGGTIEGLKYASSLGITAMEMEWVQRVPVNPEHMEAIRETAQNLGMHLTVHAPYYVNLNAKEPEKLEASKRRIVDALTMSQIAGVTSVCVHPAFYLQMDPDVVYDNVRRATDDILKKKSQFPDVNLAFETMGKGTQFGTLEEVLRLSKEFDIYPCIDPAHMHARTNGAWNSTEEWNEMFDLYAEYLGERSLKHVHMHYSGIEYTEKGERKHLPLQESDAAWTDFLAVLKNRDIEGSVTCESPLMEVDTLLLKETYEAL